MSGERETDKWFTQATRNRRYHRTVVLRQLLNHGDQLDRIEAKLDGVIAETRPTRTGLPAKCDVVSADRVSCLLDAGHVGLHSNGNFRWTRHGRRIPETDPE